MQLLQVDAILHIQVSIVTEAHALERKEYIRGTKADRVRRDVAWHKKHVWNLPWITPALCKIDRALTIERRM